MTLVNPKSEHQYTISIFPLSVKIPYFIPGLDLNVDACQKYEATGLFASIHYFVALEPFLHQADFSLESLNP